MSHNTSDQTLDNHPRPVMFRILMFLLALAGLVAIVTGTYWVYMQMTSVAVTVEIQSEETETITHHTRQDTVRAVLDELNVVVDVADRVSPSLDTRLEDGITIRVDKASQLILEINGKAQRIYTHETNPLAILAEHNIDLAPEDQLWVNQQIINRQLASANFTETPQHLKIVHTRQITLVDNGQSEVVTTVDSKTVADLLYEKNVSLYLADVVVPALDMPVMDKMVVTIQRSVPLHLEADETSFEARAAGTTVGEALNALGLPLVGADYSVPPENTPIVENMRIAVIRVIETIEVEQVVVPFESVEIVDNDLDSDEQRVVQIGEDGLEELRFRVRKENGLVVSRVLQTRWIVREPIPQIVAYGMPQ